MVSEDKTLTPSQEAFAQACVRLTNQQAAYRVAYEVGPNTKWTTVSSEASRLAALPHVAKRIKQLQQEAAEATAIPSAAQRIQELREIESADPNEIIGLRWVNCRHCRGIDHGYQWRDDMEYAAACDAARAAKKAMPDMSGGFDYNGTLDPVSDCTVCWGVGEQRPIVADTTKLKGPAARLYKGVKIKGNGDIEVLLHDQLKARDMLNRIQGIYKDNTAAQPPQATTASQVAAAKTPEERQRAYLRLVSG